MTQVVTLEETQAQDMTFQGGHFSAVYNGLDTLETGEEVRKFTVVAVYDQHDHGEVDRRVYTLWDKVKGCLVHVGCRVSESMRGLHLGCTMDCRGLRFFVNPKP